MLLCDTINTKATRTYEANRRSTRLVEQTEALHAYTHTQSAKPADERADSSRGRTISSSDSSFSSSFFSSSLGASAAAAPPAAAPGAAPAAGAAPPAPTFERSSFTSLPSSAFARRVAQIGSSSTDAAVVKAVILSAYKDKDRKNTRVRVRSKRAQVLLGETRTVISMPSSARMRAA